eukprot:m.191129 g.191129  ORF g.191129 m.191129 type:complete len:512 (-) comp24911_c0_seq2:99-1634(-)
MPSTHTDGGPAAPTPEVAMLRPEQHGVAMVTAGAPHHLPGPTLVGNSVADGYPSISHDFGDGDNHGQNDSVPSPSTSPTVEFPAATHHQHGMVVATPAERVVDAFIAAANRKDVDAMVSLLAPECVYINDPIKHTANGPDEIREELDATIGHKGSIVQWVVLRQVARGNYVMNERVDRVQKDTGVWQELPLMGCFDVSDSGQITRWVDYWDSGKREAQEMTVLKPTLQRRKHTDGMDKSRCQVQGGCGRELVHVKGRQGCYGPLTEIGYAHSSNSWDETRGFCPFTEAARSLPLADKATDVAAALDILKEKGDVPFRCWPPDVQRKYKAVSAQKRRKKRRTDEPPPPHALLGSPMMHPQMGHMMGHQGMYAGMPVMQHVVHPHIGMNPMAVNMNGMNSVMQGNPAMQMSLAMAMPMQHGVAPMQPMQQGVPAMQRMQQGMASMQPMQNGVPPMQPMQPMHGAVSMRAAGAPGAQAVSTVPPMLLVSPTQQQVQQRHPTHQPTSTAPPSQNL